ncbi:MAG: response regulator, partial [Deltaproteobacteria bacterium]
MAYSENCILLVDPFRNLLSAYRMVLEAEGYCVETAKDLAEIIALFSTRRFTVIITEYFPPVESTQGMLQWIEQNSPGTCVIMVTNAILDDLTYEKLLAAGVDDILTKPYSSDRILARIRKGLKQRDLILKGQELERQFLSDATGHIMAQPVLSPFYFKKCLRQELKRARRHLHPLSLLFIKVPDRAELGDRFETFSTELGRIVRGQIREEDTVGREDGGFGVLLPETDQSGSRALVK